jgi:hypothetical protein
MGKVLPLPVEQKLCQSKDDATQIYLQVKQSGSESIMMRTPHGKY